MASAPPVVPGQLSPDGRWQWDGTRWISTQAQAAHRPRLWLRVLAGCTTVFLVAAVGVGFWIHALVQGLENGSTTCLPSNFPRYPQATYAGFSFDLNGTYPGNTCHATFESNDDVDTVAAFYRSKLNTGGWQATSSGDPPDQVTFQAAASGAPFGTVKVALISLHTEIAVDTYTLTCLPLGFPTYPRAMFGGMSTESSASARTCEVAYESNDGVASIHDFYMRKLTTGKWQVTASLPSELGFALMDARNKIAASGTVTFAVSGDRTEIRIMSST